MPTSDYNPKKHGRTYKCYCHQVVGRCVPCRARLTKQQKADLIRESSRKKRKEELRKQRKQMQQFGMTTTGNEELDREIENA